LKDDLRRLQGGFPKREVVEVPVVGLKEDNPELLLPRLLDEYRQAREERLVNSHKSVRMAATLVLCSLQKRLLSSIEAFACTLRVHRKSFEAAANASAVTANVGPGLQTGPNLAQLKLLTNAPDADDERAEAAEDDVTAQDDAVMAAATARTMGEASADVYKKERDLLTRMSEVADAARGLPDARVTYLINWIKKHNQRVLIFTEYSDTKRYLEKQLRAAVTQGRESDPLIATYHGGMTDEAREDVKRAFNADPQKHQLRVLIATDAAREGVNLQNHCADLFHFDVPWNPSRVEQRNGRIDRKLQRAEEVRCHYFIYEQRPEDRVLKALVEKTKTIRRELGSLAPVLERKLEDRLSMGFARKDAAALANAIRDEQLDAERLKTTEAELESGRKREADLKTEISGLQDLLEKSRNWLRLDEADLRQAISCGLELLGANALQPTKKDGEFQLPDLSSHAQTDPSWMHTLDTLRAPQRKGQPVWEWRKQQPIRPVVFEDQGSLDATDVHLHLEHRFVQRLLGRFRSQGFVHHDLTRACVVLTKDPVPRVILLGRLSLYGQRASRLHDQVLAVAARWADATIRSETLKPYADATLDKTLELLEQALSAETLLPDLPLQVRQRLSSGASRDLDELRPHLKVQADDLSTRATAELRARGDREATEMRAILETQRKRIQATAVEKEKDLQQPGLFDQEERKQVEADKRYWHKRLEELARELDTEPARIRQSYEVKTARFEPVGLIYLWPVTG